MTIKLEKKHLILGAVVIAVCLVMGFGYHFYSVYSYEQNAKEFKARSSAILMPMAVVLDDYQKNWRSAYLTTRHTMKQDEVDIVAISIRQ